MNKMDLTQHTQICGEVFVSMCLCVSLSIQYTGTMEYEVRDPPPYLPA